MTSSKGLNHEDLLFNYRRPETELGVLFQLNKEVTCYQKLYFSKILLFSLVFTSFQNCLVELREQADSDDGFIGKTFEQLRELYAEDFPQYFEEEDMAFEAPVKNQGLTEIEDKKRQIEELKDFLSGKRQILL